MSRFSLSRDLPYQPDQVIDLVSDIKSYPQFIPWLVHLRTYNHQDSETLRQCDADVAVGFKMFSESFSTRVVSDFAAKTVSMSLIRGPFRRLLGQWTFMPIEGGTKVTLNMDVEISNPLLNIVFKANYERAIAKIMGVFEARAKTLFET
jgi:coenzyme Q-binding protein COQ10